MPPCEHAAKGFRGLSPPEGLLRATGGQLLERLSLVCEWGGPIFARMWSTLSTSAESLLDQHNDPPEGLLGAAGSQLLHGLRLVLDWEDFLDQDAVFLGLPESCAGSVPIQLATLRDLPSRPCTVVLLTRTQYI